MNYTMYVIRAADGEIWRYTNGKPVVYDTKKDATLNAQSLDKSRKWKVVRATLTVRDDL